MTATQRTIYNTIYEKLVEGENDWVGAIAYCFYKKRKHSFFEEMRKQGRDPSQAEVHAFYVSQCLPEQIASYRTLGKMFFESVLRTYMDDADAAYKLQLMEGLVGDQLTSIKDELKKGKTVMGFLSDATKIIISTMAAIFIIGVLLFGYRGLSTAVSFMEGMSGVHQAIQAGSTATGSHSSTPPTTTDGSLTP